MFEMKIILALGSLFVDKTYNRNIVFVLILAKIV